MERGKIILNEGTDGSGKETQTKLLYDRLKDEGIPIKIMSFPRYNTPTGRIVGECYLGKDLGNGGRSWFGEPAYVNPIIASLYYAADRKAAAPKIERIINSGNNLILDRWVESNMGHQGGKEKDYDKRSELISLIEKLEYGLLELPKPDCINFLYMPTDVAIELRKRRDKKDQTKPDGHESNISHLRNAEDTYLQLSNSYGWNKIDCTKDRTIATLKTPEEIHEEIYRHVEQKLFGKIIL